VRTSRFAATVATALLACVLGSCEAESPIARPDPPSGASPGQESTQDAREPVADDLQRLADRFVGYAVGDARSFPHRESVSLAIGGEVVVSIDDVAAPLVDGRLVVIRPRQEHRTCAGDFPWRSWPTPRADSGAWT
jgi:hypothetical protein